MDGWIDWLGCLADWQVDIEIDNIDVYQDAVSRSPVCTNQPVTLYPKDKKASRGVQGLVNVGTKTRFLDVSGFSFALAILENVVLLCLPRIYADAFPSRHGASDLKMGVSENSVPLLGIMAIIGNIPYFQTNPDDPFLSVQFVTYLGQLCRAARWPTLAGPESKVQEVQAQGHQRCPSRGAWHGDGTGPLFWAGQCCIQMAMDQYLLIPFLMGWTSIYQLFWCEQKGYKVWTHCQITVWRHWK